ncbi:adenine phosphoribosyltransferase [Corallococcus praedator]|uniref:Adenine phosphoribosyltransferase n=1 Tax=Corallococcus praedator TaxID=2316724 RepID=A0ABX9Q886_9BACT|nr:MULTISPECIES: adenine phosphoribosyltransferase [Corallococcus]RKH00012.1 adenine phosphoribosyltransferase [Corallococcus sp. CA047B]RKH19203.1 adenine phosphoribosyltransferase [Corallococcus sp. CA031C]RKH94768.1 adenine phosphoribosyltransferase [Corallococcus praedator]
MSFDPTLVSDLQAVLRDVPDFPKPGIVFKDITPMLADPRLYGRVVNAMSAPFRGKHITKVVGVESRGFLLGAPMALALDAGFVPARKPGKLPHRRIIERYSLEYGADGVEMHEDAILKDERILVVDDVLATGGTADATARLVSRLGGQLVGFSFLITLDFLEGAKRLGPDKVTSLLTF